MSAAKATGREAALDVTVHYPQRRSSERRVAPRQSSNDRVAVYRARVEPAYRRFARQLRGWDKPDSIVEPVDPSDCPPPTIGLLTFPNSGTSWFARVALVATGICRHTVYRSESMQPLASRGVFALHRGSEARLPGPEEPVLVKSHVRFFASGRNEQVADQGLAELADEWQRSLPALTGAVRLVRNPVDNIRARYHHYLKKHPSSQSLLSFPDFVSDDITNYLVWHTCCDLSLGGSLLSLDYDELLRDGGRSFLEALRYAGYQVEADDVDRALSAHPPKYQLAPPEVSSADVGSLPVHLDTYSVDDLEWLATRMEQWLT